MNAPMRVVAPVDAGTVDVRSLVVRDEDGFPFTLVAIGDAANPQPVGRLNQVLDLAVRMFAPTVSSLAGMRRLQLPWAKAPGLPTLH